MKKLVGANPDTVTCTHWVAVYIIMYFIKKINPQQNGPRIWLYCLIQFCFNLSNPVTLASNFYGEIIPSIVIGCCLQRHWSCFFKILPLKCKYWWFLTSPILSQSRWPLEKPFSVQSVVKYICSQQFKMCYRWNFPACSSYPSDQSQQRLHYSIWWHSFWDISTR